MTNKGKGKVEYDANQGDKFIVKDADTGEIIRGVSQVNVETGEYIQFYVHTPSPSHKQRIAGKVKIAGKRIIGNVYVIPGRSRDFKRWEFLEDIIRKNNYTSGAEIGVAKGATTYHIIDRFPDLKYIAVDYWPTSQFEHLGKQWRRKRKKRGNPSNLILLNKPSVQAALEVEDNSLDFVFIDGEHSYKGCLSDIKAWHPKIREGGMVMGHDINWDTVRAAVVDFYGEDGFYIWSDDNVWYLIKGAEQIDPSYSGEEDCVSE